MCVCLRVNHNDVTWLGVKIDQGLPCICHHIPGCVASHSRTPCGSQTLVALWRHLQDIWKANDVDLVHHHSILGRFDLEMGQVDKDTDGEKDDDRIEDEQAVCHLFNS